MTLFSILNLGQSGARAAQYGVHVASENVANLSTPGYSRRVARFAEELSSTRSGLPFGQGVRTLSAERAADAILGRRARDASATAFSDSARASALEAAAGAYPDVEGGGISAALDALAAALTELGAHPSEPSARREVLARAEGFAAEMRRTAGALEDARADLDTRIRGEVDSINRISRELAAVNRELGGESPAPEVLDCRDRLLRELAQHTTVEVVEDAQHRVTVSVAQGHALVTEAGARSLEARVGAGGHVEVHLSESGIDSDLTARMRGGELGGMLAARDQDLVASLAALDQVAFDFAGAINAVHAAGYGADGVTGRNLYATPAQVAGAARTFTLDPSVAGNVDALATATDPALLPGDNRNALALAAIFDQASVGGVTPRDAVADAVQVFGSRLYAADRAAEGSAAASERLDILEKSMSGVSLDEEMAALMQYRTAYQASAEVIRTADEMLQEVLALKR